MAFIGGGLQRGGSDAGAIFESVHRLVPDDALARQEWSRACKSALHY